MNSDDPKFTAHVLGELDDLTPAERAEIEALLASDPAAAADAEEMRTLGARLRTELQSEEGQPLREEQRAAVLKSATEPASATEKIVRFPRRAAVLSAIAACLVVGVSVALLFPAMRAEKEAVRKSLATNAPNAIHDAAIEDLSGLNISTPAESSAPLPSGSQPQLAAVTAANQTVPVFSVHPAPSAPIADPQGELVLSERRFQTAAASPAVPMPAPPQKPVGPITLDGGNRGSIALADAAPAKEPMMMMKAASGTLVTAGKVAVPASPSLALDSLSTFTGGTTVKALNSPTADRSYIAAGSTKSKTAAISSVNDLNGNLRPESDTRTSAHYFIERLDEPTSESFDAITDNAFLTVRESPLSTFSIDVDTASYAIVRRFLNENQRPPKSAVRIEELINYFTYDYPQPQGEAPFSATLEVATCPWTPEHRLVRIGLKGREMARDQRPASNLVFLIDVSGSMNMPIKLPLLKQSLGLLIDQLGAEDQVAIVVYAGNSGCVLQPTHDKAKMRAALKKLEAGGSTNGASGIELAYQLATHSFIKGGTNRVILATDGDWNVGVTNQSDLLDMIAKKAKSGVFLTVLGFGMDNLNDSMLVKLADKGNGNYAYIDTLIEAKKVLVDQLSGTLVTIAKDVKIQVEFNPAHVAAYRLIGYEKRLLAKEDFNDDKKDAGEIGAGHTVTALYEIVPAGKELPGLASVDTLKYQPRPVAAPEPRPAAALADAPVSKEMLTLKLRYKAPDGDTSKLLEFSLTDAGGPWEKSSRDFRFAAAVASYGMLLRDSPHKGQATWSSTLELAEEGKGEDTSGYRRELMAQIEKAKELAR